MKLGNQIFIRFYFVVVTSVIFVGWSVDALWQNYSSNDGQLSYEQVLPLLAEKVNNTKDSQQQSLIESYNDMLGMQLSIINGEQVQGNDIRAALYAGEIITLQNVNDDFISYIKLDSSDLLLSIEIPDSQSNHWLKYLWIMVFYSVIAAIIYIWTLPLSRDLQSIERAAINFAHSKWNSTVKVSPRSSVKHIADAYNNLLIKIKQLINDQQEMSHAISHELRTPLARIKFSLELATNSNNEKMVKQQLSSIGEDITEIQELVNELLSYATLKRTTFIANIEKGDIKSLISTLVEKLSKNSNDKTIRYDTICSESQVYCDSDLIERCLQNLITNGLRYCKHNVVVNFKQNNGFNYLSVDDDGEGIAKNERERVFNSFVRITGETQGNQKGFGLGLAIVKRISLLHHGKVKIVRSKLGGASFIFKWPVDVKDIK